MGTRIPLMATTLKLTITGTPTLVPQVTMLDVYFGGEADMIEITDLDDTAHQHISGLKDYGTLDFKLNYNPANAVHAAIISQWAAGTEATFLATAGDSGNTTFETVGPIKTCRISGGGSNSLYVMNVSQKINSSTITP